MRVSLPVFGALKKAWFEHRSAMCTAIDKGVLGCLALPAFINIRHSFGDHWL
jgi:hypothetical protein